MKTQPDNTKEQQNAAPKIQQEASTGGTATIEDNRPSTVYQRKLRETMNASAAHKSLPIQRKENKTGLPDTLKTGIENLSGYAMDDVKVHYNSNKPTQLQAHAYAQGTDIHLAPGQEKHLPHEAWHVVQQKQGRVKPTMQLKGKVNVNDDAGLEKEADVMGGKAKTVQSQSNKGKIRENKSKSEIIQGRFTSALAGITMNNFVQIIQQYVADLGLNNAPHNMNINVNQANLALIYNQYNVHGLSFRSITEVIAMMVHANNARARQTAIAQLDAQVRTANYNEQAAGPNNIQQTTNMITLYRYDTRDTLLISNDFGFFGFGPVTLNHARDIATQWQNLFQPQRRIRANGWAANNNARTTKPPYTSTSLGAGQQYGGNTTGKTYRMMLPLTMVVGEVQAPNNVVLYSDTGNIQNATLLALALPGNNNGREFMFISGIARDFIYEEDPNNPGQWQPI